MQILTVFACADLFSYDAFQLHRTAIEGDWSKGDLVSIRNEFVSNFNAKRFSKLSLTHINIADDGAVTVLENLQGQHPLKTRREINPAAAAARKARQQGIKLTSNPAALFGTPAFVGGATAVFTDFTANEIAAAGGTEF